jgi:uncharacterized Zn finger protein
MNWWAKDDDDEFDDEYDNFDEYEVDCSDSHESAPDANVIDGPIHALNRRGSFGTQWLGKQWLIALEHLYADNRMQTGRTYARNGSVQRLEIDYGNVYGLVQGTQRYPYCTTIKVKKLSDEMWTNLLTILRIKAVYAAKLLAGEMPSDVEAILQTLGASLFPQSRKDISFSCTCPDYANPCKHATALSCLLVEQFEADPFVMFHLLGRTRAQVLEALNIQRSGSVKAAKVNATLPAIASAEPTETLPLTSEDFGAMVEAYRPLTKPVEPARPPLFDQYGEPPAELKRGLEMIYRAVTAGAKGWLND